MPHLIDKTTGKAAIAYVGKTPWHGLGEQINPDSTIDDWKIASGLNFDIVRRPMVYDASPDNSGTDPRPLSNLFAHVRTDTGAAIGHGSKRFQLFQPGDVLEFFRDIVDRTHFRIETAGSLNGGAKYWAMAKFDHDLTLGQSDQVKSYLLLATANDGTMNTVADFTSTRVVCNNTLSLAVGNNGGKARIKVPHSSKFNAADVKAQLGMMDDRLSTFADDADRLTQARISDQDAIKLFFDLYAKHDEKGNLENKKSVKKVTERLFHLYKRGPGADLETANGTLWGAVNAVTHYVDFDTGARSDNNRFDSGQFGKGAQVKALAFDNALTMAA